MPARLDARYPLNDSQHRAVEEASADFPDSWRLRVEPAHIELPGGFRLYVDGPGVGTSRPFRLQASPVEIATYLRVVRTQLVR